MKRNFLFVMLALGGILATPLTARADISHRLTSSTQLQVDAGYTSVSRAANTYSTSGNGNASCTSITSLGIGRSLIIVSISFTPLVFRMIYEFHVVFQGSYPWFHHHKHGHILQ